MDAVRSELYCAAPSRVPVLIQGETGTGNPMVARLLHGLSGRGPLEVVAARTLTGDLPPTLREPALRILGLLKIPVTVFAGPPPRR